MNYRVASVISEYFYVIAVLLVIVGALGGFWLYQELEGPRYRTVRESRVLYSYQGRFEHEPVGVGSPDRDTSSYSFADFPKLKIGFVFAITGWEHARGLFEIDSDLKVSWRRENRELWSDTMDKAENVYVLDKDTARLDYVLDTSNLNERARLARENLPFEGGSLQVKIINDLSLDGEIDGRGVERTETYELPIELEETSYTVGTDLTSRRDVTERYTRLAEVKVALSQKLFPLVLLIAPLLVLGLVTYEWRNLDERDLERLKEEHERGKYEEWISRGKLPDLSLPSEIEIESLEDLVDVAVDSETRVIYDEDKSTYYAIDEGVLYFYERIES